MRSPNASLLDPGFRYIPARETDVAATFKRFGFDPRANEKRRERLKVRASVNPARASVHPVPALASVKSA